MKHDEIKIGEYYWLEDYSGYKRDILIFVIGKDSFNGGKFAISAKEWDGRIGHIENEDYPYIKGNKNA